MRKDKVLIDMIHTLKTLITEKEKYFICEGKYISDSSTTYEENPQYTKMLKDRKY